MTMSQHDPNNFASPLIKSTVKRALCISDGNTIGILNDAVELLGWRLDCVETSMQAIASLQRDNYEAIITSVHTPNYALFDTSEFDEESKKFLYKSSFLENAMVYAPATFRITFGMEATSFPDIREACFDNGADAVVNDGQELFSALFALITPPDEQGRNEYSMREQQLIELAGGVVTRRVKKMMQQTTKQQTLTLEQPSRRGLRVENNFEDSNNYSFRLAQENPANTVRVVHVSDTNGEHRSLNIQPGNLFIHTGNFTDGNPTTCLSQFQDFLGWIHEDILTKFNQVVFIAGNQDFFLDIIMCKYNAVSRQAQRTLNKFLSKHRNVAFLENTSITYQGLKIYGTSTTLKSDNLKIQSSVSTGSLPFHAFERPIDTYIRPEGAEDACDILVTHRPPSLIFESPHYELPTDRLYPSRESTHTKKDQQKSKRGKLFGRRKKAGSKEDCATKKAPRLHAFGHYGKDFGMEDFGGTILLNGCQDRLLKQDKYGGGTPLVVDLPMTVE